MEVLFQVKLFISKIVNESSLLYEIILSIESNKFHLLFCVSQVLELLFLSYISPHSKQLLGFISRVNIVKNCEFGTKEVSEVSDFNVTQIKGDQILMMEDHTS